MKPKFCRRGVLRKTTEARNVVRNQYDATRILAFGRHFSGPPRARRTPQVYAIEQMELSARRGVYVGEPWRFPMNHKGVEYTIAMTAVPGVWKWQFRIGDTVKSGRTETRIDLLAIRRVQLRIDCELKKTERGTAPLISTEPLVPEQETVDRRDHDYF